MSCISKLCEPGASTNTALVFGCINLLDAGADQRVVISGGDTEFLEQSVAEHARRPVDAVGDQDVVAAAGNRQQRGRNRRQPRRHQRDAGAFFAFQFGDRAFQRLRRRGAAPAILIARAMRDLIFSRRIEDGRRVIDRGIDETMLALRVAARGHQARIGFDWGVRFFRHGRHRLPQNAPVARNRRRRTAYRPQPGERQPLDLTVGSFCDASDRGVWRIRPRAVVFFRGAMARPAEKLLARSARGDVTELRQEGLRHETFR